jgi:hypothetical protein
MTKTLPDEIENRLTLEHVGREERKPGTAKRSQEGVARDGRGREHEVRVDEVVEGLQEDGHEPKAREKARKRGNDPVHRVAIARPAEPEEPDGESGTARNHAWKTPLRNGDAVVGFELSIVPGLLSKHSHTGEELPYDHTEEREIRDAG